MVNVLVYGFYGKNNLGDDLFMEAFRNLFPNYNFKFTDQINANLLECVSVVFFGGGSFLTGEPNIKCDALPLLKSKKIFYIGVGVENKIHPVHVDLMKIAKLIAVRSSSQVFKVNSINTNTYCIPDLAFCLQKHIKLADRDIVSFDPKSVLVLTNIYVVPSYMHPHWMHVCWEYFKSEFAQFLDTLICDNYNVRFFAMSQNKKLHDSWASIEIMNQMKNKNVEYIIDNQSYTMESVAHLISAQSVVITQRYHGAVLSEMVGTPYLVLSHHDKLNNSYFSHGTNLTYYGVNKTVLIDQFNKAINMGPYSCSVDLGFFETLQCNINKLINEE